MNLIESIAQECSFSVDQIIADVICPEYEDPGLGKLVDAFIGLPQSVRDAIVESLTKRQRLFAQVVIRECIEVVDEVGADSSGRIIRNIENRFDC